LGEKGEKVVRAWACGDICVKVNQRANENRVEEVLFFTSFLEGGELEIGGVKKRKKKVLV